MEETSPQPSLSSFEFAISNAESCIAHAQEVLSIATARFIGGTLTYEEAETVATLAEAWRELADAWLDSQMFEEEDDGDEHSEQPGRVVAEDR